MHTLGNTAKPFFAMDCLPQSCARSSFVKWSTTNIAVDKTHIANSLVEADFEILEDAFKALHELL